MIDVSFDCKINFNKKDVSDFIIKSIYAILKILKNKEDNFYISILLTNNDKIRKINFQYRKIDKETNVLSFTQNEKRMLKEAKNHLILGDIVISIEKIISEAEQQKKIFWDHLSHMLIHSILHLLGYDHENKNDAIMMENKERDIFTKLSEEKII